MKLRKSFFAALMFVAFTLPSFANNSSPTRGAKDAKAIAEVQSLIKKIDFNFANMDDATVKVHFMVNTANEIVVLRTSDENLDLVIKSGLNYKELKNRDLEANKVYILPVTFQKTGQS